MSSLPILPTLPTLPTLSSQFIKHLQNFQPNEKGEKCLILLSKNTPINEIIHDTIYWGDLQICDLYEDSDIEKHYPMTEDDKKDLESMEDYSQRIHAHQYCYDDDGNPIDGRYNLPLKNFYYNGNLVDNQYEFPEIRSFQQSTRMIMGDFSDPTVREKTIEVLKICGEGVNVVEFKCFYTDFGTEVLEYLPNLEKVYVDYYDGTGTSEDSVQDHFDFIENLPSVKELGVHYFGYSYFGEKEKLEDIETHIFDVILNNENLKNLEKLYIGSFDCVSEETIETLLDFLPNLKKIKIAGEVMSDEIAEMILEKLENLEELSIRHYDNVSKEFIEKMSIEYPHVKILK